MDVHGQRNKGKGWLNQGSCRHCAPKLPGVGESCNTGDMWGSCASCRCMIFSELPKMCVFPINVLVQKDVTKETCCSNSGVCVGTARDTISKSESAWTNSN